MRAFRCPVCAAEVYFENSVCLGCGSALGYSRAEGSVVAITAGSPVCANLGRCGCTWLADPSGTGLCFSCRLTRTRPADDDPDGLRQWAVAETAKRRLVFGLDELGLPVKLSDGYLGLAFDLLSSARGPVRTGYANGVITLDLAEGDDAHREAMRVSMGEPYRTVLGHLRHEVGHYYAELLCLTAGRVEEFRALFGDERTPYAAALCRHYTSPPSPGWQDRYISAYAAVHPLEDFAEVFAHYLHLADALQSADAFGLLPAGPNPAGRAAGGPDAAEMIERWLPLSRALNQLERSLGRGDLYPFVLAPAVLQKLDFVAGLVAAARPLPGRA